ncbi:receptor-type tyrosine-protein phosphatase mu-like [Ruditapes philippinarum]|uniref:receptor-type tyrosine-protein phosphatase mu-like n=1 Tax=Ruditapes philippinarum TaxID=129788 RepID=UPI00295B3123|nr:receptor-type tyrosine-protein phosphatase mu-like [Ruditapes philippinarum]
MVLIMRMFGILILVASLILNCGRCDSSCTDFGKVGPTCYIKNIALNEKSRHDSNIDIPKYSDLANDGDLSTCSYTSDKNTAAPWWNLWLPKYTLFKKLEFVTLDSHLSNFKGFEVQVFNTSFDNFKAKQRSMTGKTVCYQHNNTSPENKKIEVTCDEFHYGNLLRLQLSTPRLQLVLCDFRIYEECENGNWGWNCDKRCGNCDDITCDRITGTCRQCEPGFKLSKCTEECADWTYGLKCAHSCSIKCGGVCNKKTGMCSNCKTGWKGDRCTEECNNGTFGKDCQNKCNSNCLRSGVNEICNNVDGTCLNGCKGGYQGSHCNIKCYDGKWGINCTHDCGKCLTSPCNHLNGHCQDGCAAGYKKTRDCHTECDDGKWGINCTYVCGKCFTSPCNHVNGYCQDGCAAGYKKTLDCRTECDDGKWGINCKNECGKCLTSPCNHVNGHCKDGCAAGYKKTLDCRTECDDGKWGINCTNDCGKCFTSPCNNVNGHCKNGCAAGYKRTRDCTAECDDGKWGINCTTDCGKCLTLPCNHVNGYCQDGCAAGYKKTLDCTAVCDNGFFGKNCQNRCNNNCLWSKASALCDNVDGTCLNGCKEGYHGSQCDIECKDGTYGNSCVFNCSQTCDGICNKMNGTCNQCLQGWSGDFCDKALIEDFSPFTGDTSGTAGIVGALTVLVILVLLIVLAVFIYRRKQNTERRNNELTTVTETNRDIKDDRANVKLEEPSNSVSYVNASELVHKMREINAVSNDKGNGKSTFIEERKVEVEYSIPKTAQGVLLSEFETYVRSGLANTDIFFQQFQQIPYGMQYASDVATKPKNHCKNRYKAMYAYDHSRVILRTLPDQPGSDYINASKIMGNTGKVSYIAAQGPISSTLGDFWRMIWEQTVRTIVMLTNLTEEGKMKCLKYWPEAGEFVEHGNIVVLSELEDVFAEFTIRRLKIHQKNKPDRARTLGHFHFTAWPDKDVPRSTSCLLHFWHQVRNHDEKKARPWLVHCSAGVGRTGTFIGLDVLCDMGKDYGFVDVFKCVDDLRKQRVNMVQTKNQYKYLHCAVLEALVLPSEPAHMDNFHAIYNHLKMTDPEAGKTSLLMQYETLTNDCEVITSVEDPNEDKYGVAKRDENKNKNRFDDILAPGECRPFLLTKVSGCTDYINAIFIPGYRDKFGYILTQTPLQSTAIDCCRLVYEQEIKVIVTFQEYSKKDVGIYLPNEGTANFGPFTMKFLSEKELTYYTKRNYKLLYKSETHAVSQLIFKHWPPSRMTPPDPTKMLNFLENLDTLRRQNDCKPILVQCFNGAERSGLVVALMNILEQLKFNKEVSIPLVVRQLKCRRQQIIPNFEQFTFCYDVVLSHIESHTTYANM